MLVRSLCAAAALTVTAHAQVVITTNSTTDTMVAFNPVDGSVVSSSLFAIPTTGGTKVAAIQVNNEIWMSDQIGDTVTRFDPCGNTLGVIGPTFPGGGFDNIRGMTLIGGLVYVTNDGAGNGATANSLVTLDLAGNHVATIPLSFSSPYSVIPWQGDLLVASDAANDDVHRYTTAGVSVGTFHNSTGLNFAHQIALASDGNVWCAGFSTNNVVKLDATSGAILSSFAASGARGVYELANGNVLWTNGSGAFVYDTVALTSTQVFAGSHTHLNLLLPQQAACHRPYGTGCHSFSGDWSNLFQLFADAPAAKAALDGNALQFTLTPTGYVATWVPGSAAGLYIAPSIGATVIADADSTTTTILASAAIPIPGGTQPQWTVSSNGVVTAGGTGNQGTSGTPTLASTASQTGLAFYTWSNFNPAETGSGDIKWEEVGNLLVITFDGVEFSGGTPTLAPATFQFQISLISGDVTMLWPSMSGSNSTTDTLVGCTLAAAGPTPVSESLAAAAALLLQPDTAPLSPMTLSATPSPVINPSTLVTYTANNVPEFLPSSGVYIGTLFFSVNPLPGGFPLTGILTTVPGCNAWIATLDVDLGGTFNIAPTLAWNFTFDNVVFAPGNVIAAQAVALFDPSAPLLNGESGGFLLSNGVLSSIWPQ
ncbi:MAG: hypothetical protein JNL08_17030 [Planctomycetes bacterium]|nr:hypothetical protein [Planctomycetota bacterium]